MYPFIDESQRVRERATGRATTCSSRGADSSALVAGQSAFRSSSRERPRDGSASSNSSSAELWLVAFRNNIYISHLLDRLFMDNLGMRNPGLGQKSWVVNAVDKNRDGSIHSNVMFALAFAFFGKLHFQKDIIDQGAVFYGKAFM